MAFSALRVSFPPDHMVDEWNTAMNIIICGAGKTGAHAAEVLAADGANVTVVDESQRSEERRVGKEFRTRWSPHH